MDANSRERIAAIAALIQAKAEEIGSNSDVSPTQSRRQKDRLRSIVADNYTSLEELNHVFEDINSSQLLAYFDDDEAGLIRQAASSLSDARRAIRRLANREWLRKRPTNP